MGEGVGIWLVRARGRAEVKGRAPAAVEWGNGEGEGRRVRVRFESRELVAGVGEGRVGAVAGLTRCGQRVGVDSGEGTVLGQA